MSKNNNSKNCGNGKTKPENGRTNTNTRQPRKDSKSKRVNLDNERVSKFKDKEGKGYLTRQDSRVNTSKSPNDISWYSKNPELLRAAASVPFNPILGATFLPNSPARIPGIMKFNFSFNFGSELNGDVFVEKTYPTALNQSFKSMYSFLVHANSRNYSYEYQDLGMLVVAGMQVFTVLGHLCRAYGYAKRYMETTVYSPEFYLKAMGFDPTDVRNNLSNMWFDINEMIAQTQQIWIPNTLPLLQRWFWMCTNIFTDAPGKGGQAYMFQPNYFYQYNETSDNKGGCLEIATYDQNAGDATLSTVWVAKNPTDTLTWVQWKSLVQHMIDRLVNSEDRGIIMGDILNAYGSDKIFAMAPIPADFTLDFSYNPEVLTQIENITFVPSTNCMGIRQDESGMYPIMQYPSHQQYVGAAPDTPILNFHQETSPTPEQIMIATRLTSAGARSVNVQSWSVNGDINSESEGSVTQATTAAIRVAPLATGSEIVTDATIYYYSETTSEVNHIGTVTSALAPTRLSNNNQWATVVSGGGLATAFDWHPFQYAGAPAAASITAVGVDLGIVTMAYGDYDNYTALGFEVYAKLHNAALLSEFGVPQM